MLSAIFTISSDAAAGTMLAGSVVEIGTTASVRAVNDTGPDEVAAYNKIA